MEGTEFYSEPDNIYEKLRELSFLSIIICGSSVPKGRDLKTCLARGNIKDVLEQCESGCESRDICGLYWRLKIAEKLMERKYGTPLVMELEFAKANLLQHGAFIDLLEDAIINQRERDRMLIIIIIPEEGGIGPLTEFNVFFCSELKDRIRLIVHRKYNPLYIEDDKMGYASARYLTFLGRVGYLFVFDSYEELPLLVRRIVEAEKKRISAERMR